MSLTQPLWPAVLGRFAWHDLPFVRAWQDPTGSEIIGSFAGGLVVVGALVMVALLTRYRAWKPLWTDG